MSFLDTIVDYGKKAVGYIGDSGIGSTLARTAVLGLLLNQVNKSVNKDNQKPQAATTNLPDSFARAQVNPDTNNAIPVAYGTAFLGGSIVDAALTADNQTMWYALAIAEKTGPLIDGTPSVTTFEKIYWNENEVLFHTDGVSVRAFIDADGNISTDPDSFVKIYCYNNGSSSPVLPVDYPGTQEFNAYQLFPNWTTAHTMDNLIFCLVKITYNKEKNLTELGNLSFKLKNTLTEPGDVLYDYMTNTRYGAGISLAEIYI